MNDAHNAHHAQAGTTAQDVDTQALDLTELNDQAYERIMKELLADLGHQRRSAQTWRLRALVMPKPECAMA